MNKILRYSFVALLAMVFGNLMASESVDFTAQGYENAAEVAGYQGTNFAITFAGNGASNNPKWYNTGTAIRMYAKNSMTITSSKTIIGIKFTLGSDGPINENNEGFSTGTYDRENTLWTGSTSELTLTNVAKSGNQIRLQKLDIYFEGETIPTGGDDPDPYTLVGAGTLDNPFTASDAIYLANKGEYASEEVYITGKVFNVKSTDANIEQYGNIDYFISEDGQEANPSFEIFRGLYFDGEKFTVENKVQVGDVVVVKGKLTTYNSQAETAQGAVLVKLNGSTTNISAIKADSQNGAIYNIAGQKVNAGYKGLVIKNGKKFVVK